MPVPPPGPPPADDKEGLASLGWGFPGTYVVIALAFAWPWFLGTYLAVQFGATNPSLTRTITGSAFEAPWLAFLAFMAFYQLAKRSGARKLGLAQAVKRGGSLRKPVDLLRRSYLHATSSVAVVANSSRLIRYRLN
jgi:hypothetical protein